MLKVAVIGSGPAGVYSAGALTQHGDVLVDVFDKLPTPFGLVRYGVAPDHPKIKSISTALEKVLEDPAVRFLGNVEVGTQITLEELHRHYDALIFASGAMVPRRLGVPGENLAGSFAATEFVAWYCGHPDEPIDSFTLQSHSVAVIGSGNVALDVTRMLAKLADDLRDTDMPGQVLDVLERSRVEDIHLIGRRGPVQAKFTTPLLRELGELSNADVLVDPDELALDETSRAKLATDPNARRNYEVLQAWAERPPSGRSRRVHVRFLLRPVEVLGDVNVSGLRLERTRLDRTGLATGTGETTTVDASMILCATGHRGLSIPGIPFNEETGVIPNVAGRVLGDGSTPTGVYVAGWIKRGATGVIGTNKHDAKETVTALLEDAPTLPPAPVRDPDAVLRLLAERDIDVVTWQGWSAIEHAEADLGRAQGRERAKITDREALLRAAAGGAG
jgi:ferredoxin/flavodoxin---NADP+ reductase